MGDKHLFSPEKGAKKTKFKKENSRFHFTIFVFKCSILLKPVPEGVHGTLHFPLQSMKKLTQQFQFCRSLGIPFFSILV
jgi:hypothetical protein